MYGFIKMTAALAAGLLIAGGVTVPSPSMAADVDRPPIRTITGAGTSLDVPMGIARDAHGLIYAANYVGGSVTVHAADAAGNVAPVRQIKGPGTGLVFPTDVAVDSNGYIYVTSFGNNSVRIFAPLATGDVAPLRVITGAATQLDGPVAITVAPNGNMYVANFLSDSVVQFTPTASGNTAPITGIAGAGTQLQRPSSLLRAPDGLLYVGNSASITTYPGSANGNVAPSRIIGGLAAGLSDVDGLALDRVGNLYATSTSTSTSTGTAALHVFAPGAHGNATPKVSLVGASTGLSGPWGIAIDSAHRLYVVQNGTYAINVYAPLVAPPVAPGAVRSLKVTGRAGAARRPVTWKAPAPRPGAGPVTQYRVVVKKGTRVVVATKVRAAQRKVVLKKSRLRSGRHVVTVRARNATGLGVPVSKRFTVRK